MEEFVEAATLLLFRSYQVLSTMLSSSATCPLAHASASYANAMLPLSQHVVFVVLYKYRASQSLTTDLLAAASNPIPLNLT
jgi:hypothetical protein